jgi:hypothetical protein
MRNDIKKFVQECRVCQENKHETVLSAGLLHPLPIPSRVWSDISLDFIEGLLVSQGFSIIMVVIDRLTKYGHFLPLAHPYSASTVAQLFLANIFKLHALYHCLRQGSSLHEFLLVGAFSSPGHHFGFQLGLPPSIGWADRGTK